MDPTVAFRMALLGVNTRLGPPFNRGGSNPPADLFFDSYNGMRRVKLVNGEGQQTVR